MFTALYKDQRGSYFVEMALVLIGVALAVFTAASGLANNGVVPKYTAITTEIQNVTVPDLTP
jgi:Flp pilus assembly pilin Flp